MPVEKGSELPWYAVWPEMVAPVAGACGVVVVFVRDANPVAGGSRLPRPASNCEDGLVKDVVSLMATRKSLHPVSSVRPAIDPPTAR